MAFPEKETIEATYNTAIARIRLWAVASAVLAPIGMFSWKVVVPLLDGAIARWVFYASATITIFAAAWFLLCLILLATYSHEKKERLRTID